MGRTFSYDWKDEGTWARMKARRASGQWVEVAELRFEGVTWHLFLHSVGGLPVGSGASSFTTTPGQLHVPVDDDEEDALRAALSAAHEGPAADAMVKEVEGRARMYAIESHKLAEVGAAITFRKHFRDWLADTEYRPGADDPITKRVERYVDQLSVDDLDGDMDMHNLEHGASIGEDRHTLKEHLYRRNIQIERGES